MVTKIDITIDLCGGYLPRVPRQARMILKEKLQGFVEEQIYEEKFEFFTQNCPPELAVRVGNNNLDTCSAFNIKDPEGVKYMTVKMYNKVLDLMSRDGTKPVGSRFNIALGCQRNLDVLAHRVKRTQTRGLTRLEVSYYFDTDSDHEFGEPSFKTLFWRGAKDFMDLLVSEVLNDSEVLREVHR